MAAKTHALTIRFAPLEATVLEALSQRESESSGAVVRRAVLSYGRDALPEAEWARAVADSGAGDAWLRYESRTLGNVQRVVKGAIERMPHDSELAPTDIQLQLEAVNRRVDDLARALGVDPPARSPSSSLPADDVWSGDDASIDWTALVRELRIDARTVGRFARRQASKKGAKRA